MSDTNAQTDPIEGYTAPMTAERTDADFLDWKAAKIRASIEQTKDRGQMIPAKDVWETLGLEP